MQIIYKPIPNYEGLYEVSNTGLVRSVDRYNIDKNGKKKFYPGKPCKFDKSVKVATTYLRVTLSRLGKTKKFFVHRLVAATFIPNLRNKPYVNHLDNNGTNNSTTNLEWCTHSENMKHSQLQGRQFANQSKAGKAAGKQLRSKVLEEIDTHVGLIFGNFRILSYDQFRSGKHHVMCECLTCGSISSIRHRAVVNETISKCKKCRNIKRDKI